MLSRSIADVSRSSARRAWRSSIRVRREIIDVSVLEGFGGGREVPFGVFIVMEVDGDGG